MTTFSPRSGTHGANRCRASELFGSELANRRDERVGKIHDLVLDSGNRRIAYAVVSFGGILGVGEKYFAMPWRVIEVGPPVPGHATRVAMSINREDLHAAPGFDQDSWPDVADATWTTAVELHYRPGAMPAAAPTVVPPYGAVAAGLGVRQTMAEPELEHRRLSSLIGMDVVDAGHDALASIEDVIVDVRRATVDGVLLAFGGELGLGERMVLVPVDALRFDRDEDVFVLASNRARLETMALPAATWPPLDSDDWLHNGREQLAIASCVGPDADAAGPPAPVVSTGDKQPRG